jgi:NitT/TauT family transport system substrate-binding protein
MPGPLKIAYSDWPGWVAWDIAQAKGYFKDAGVDVALTWLEYVPSMEAFSQSKVDAVCMTNGDALVLAGSGAGSVGILINDYSNGNDMLVAAPGIKNLGELRGKKIGVEVGFVDHLLVLQALRSVGLTEADVEIVNERTHKTPELLASGSVSAIAAWQPNSGEALARVQGSKAIFTSADVPGLIYDLLFVKPDSLSTRRAEWKKVIEVWERIARYIRDPATRSDAIKIMAARVGLAPPVYARFVDGTFILDLAGNRERFVKAEGFASVYGSSAAVDRFNIENRIYKEPQVIDAVLDPSLVEEAFAAAARSLVAN